jgi:hypothetical protein
MKVTFHSYWRMPEALWRRRRTCGTGLGTARLGLGRRRAKSRGTGPTRPGSGGVWRVGYAETTAAECSIRLSASVVSAVSWKETRQVPWASGVTIQWGRTATD